MKEFVKVSENKMLKIEVFTFNMFSENTIVLWDDVTMEAAVVDPGNSNSEEDKRLSDFISSEDLIIKYMINTHCHIDHILGCGFIKEKYNPVYFAPEQDLALLKNAKQQAKMFDISIDEVPQPDKFITEETDLGIGKIKMKFLFTPGHTPGEFCINFEKEEICISGDVLFNESIGRTDLWGGDYNTLIESIQNKLFTLPDDVKIYPGHGEASTIGHEKKSNPFLI